MSIKPVSKVLHSSIDGLEIYTEATGDYNNPHVVLVHGITYSGAVYDTMCALPIMLKNLYVVRYDMRGHGRSGKPGTLHGHDSKLWGADFMAVVETYNLKSPVYVGWSYGGGLPADVFANYPREKVPISGIFYLCACPSMPALKEVCTQAAHDFLRDSMEYTTAPEALQRLVHLCIENKRGIEATWEMRCLYKGMQVVQEVPVRQGVVKRTHNDKALWQALKDGLPAYVFHGGDDPLLDGHAVVRLMKEKASNVEFNLVPGAGHTLHWEDPQETANLIVKFVQKVKGL